MGKRTQNFDWLTIILLSVLASFGLFLLLTTDKNLFLQQFIWLILTLGTFVVLSKLDSALLWWFAPFGYVFANLFLIASFLGPHIRGATRWLILGPVRLQPSEVVKPFLLLAFSWFITKYPPRNIKNIPLHVVLFAIPFFLVYKQPDLGSSLVYGAMWLGMMIAGGLAVHYVAAVILGLSVVIPWMWHNLALYQKNRILTFLNPAIDPKGAGYNAAQSTIAVGSGQIFGKGLGMGTQSHLRFLPEYHTDFIFATLVEELGFVGGFILLITYAIILWRLLMFIWQKSEHLSFFVFGFGLFSMLLVQIFINVGMNIGILPITGITLPFVSYGGSSLLSLGISFGFMQVIGTMTEPSDSIAINS
jgi:rod shape determining protein RodA